MSDPSTVRGGGEAEKSGWLQRVLGFSIPDAGRLADVIGEPSMRLRAALAAAVQRTAVPEDDDALQEVLAGLAPAFLAATLQEPEMSTAPLGPGAPIPPQDRMTGIAGLLDVLGRKLEQWDAALDDAEAGQRSLAEAQDEATLTDYRESRSRGQSLMAEVETLFGTLREQCRTFEAGTAA